jgi:hypothetical protein
MHGCPALAVVPLVTASLLLPSCTPGWFLGRTACLVWSWATTSRLAKVNSSA